MTFALGAFINQYAAAIISLILSILKIYRPTTITQNATEIFIYGGLAAIFVPFIYGSPYPVYSVLEKSKTLAEFNGNAFRALFEEGMFKNSGTLLTEFEKSKHKKNKVDALLQFFGFFVLGSLLASRMYDKKQRTAWLRPVLDLENNNTMSYFLDELVTEKTLENITKVLTQNYKKNTKILGQTIKASKNIKLISKDSKGLLKLFNDFNQRLQS